MPLFRVRLAWKSEISHSRTFYKHREVMLMLLNATCGTAVGTSWSGLVSLAFPYFSDLDSPGPLGLGLAGAATVVMSTFHTCVEWLLLKFTFSEDTYTFALLNILLNSAWSTLAYFWNGIWGKVFTRWNRRRKRSVPKLLGASGPADFLSVKRGPRHKFKTLLERMNGPAADIDTDNGPGFRLLVVKGLVTKPHSVSFVLIYCCRSTEARSWASLHRSLPDNSFFINIHPPGGLAPRETGRPFCRVGLPLSFID